MQKTLIYHRSDRAARSGMLHQNSAQSVVPPGSVTSSSLTTRMRCAPFCRFRCSAKVIELYCAQRARGTGRRGNRKIDLVLLDVMMPEMDGFTTCIELRKRTDVPVVLLTALNRPDDIVPVLRSRVAQLLN